MAYALPTLPGAAPTGYSSAYGGIPGVTDPAAAAALATQANLTNLGGAQDLASRLNKFNLGQVTSQYQAGIPNYGAMTGQSSANILSALRGEVPADVLAELQTGAAERGIAIGAPGGPNANAAYLRALGLTSLGQQKYGEEALTGAVARMPRTSIYDIAKGFVTPESMEEAANQAAVYAAAPVPEDAYMAAIAAAKQGAKAGYGAAVSPASSIASKYAPSYQTVPGMESPLGTWPTYTGSTQGTGPASGLQLYQEPANIHSGEYGETQDYGYGPQTVTGMTGADYGFPNYFGEDEWE